MNASNRASLGHSFRDALAGERLSVIAEIKRRSPSRGKLRLDADAALLASQYRDGGAACLSVLTDNERFGGSVDDLRDAREATGLPVLRKDFLTTVQHVHESADMGAGAILVILADVDSERMLEMWEESHRLGMVVLTEVRTESEFECAIECGADMIAVNQRDDPKNSQITVDFGKAKRMARLFDQLDDGIIKVAASGIGLHDLTPICEIADAGYDAALIGETLVKASDPAAKLRELLASCGSHPRMPATASS